MGSPLARRVRSPLLFGLALILVGCQLGPTATSTPGPKASPVVDSTPSSQALIATDLEAGTIDLATSLELRAWTLFGDPRLPERYDGDGSTGEDQALFEDIAANLDSLPADKRDELSRYLLRPTDPRSPFSSPPAAKAGGIALAAYASADATPAPELCEAPRSWQHDDWSPDGSDDVGFRVWSCGLTKAIEQDRFDTVIKVGSRLWPLMTYAEPDGMGLPVPDTAASQNDGNGKVDVYLLDTLVTCRWRGDKCQDIPGKAVAAAPQDSPQNCVVIGNRANACSGYLLLNKDRMDTPSFAADFAHEFFHVLQFAHNGKVDATWYHEASAVWAEWAFERESGKAEAYDRFRAYQAENRSLLYYDYDTTIQYRAWGWPLYQSIEEGPSNVFETWVAIEGATLKSEVDAAIDRQLAFSSEFRNFMVRNAQPALYFQGSSTGLEADSWRTKEDLGDFPEDSHHLSNERSALSLGKVEYPAGDPKAGIDPLAAGFDEYRVVDDKIRQVEIDISKVTNAGNADLDVLAQIRSTSGDKWTRFVGRGGKVKLCRDIAAEDVNTVLAVVISNHSIARDGNFPDIAQNVGGNYSIESKGKCDKRDLHLGGRISWNASSPGRFGYAESVSGTADVVLHVIKNTLLVAEREDHSTYNYEYTSGDERCPSSHEDGTLESGGGVGEVQASDYSIGTLNVSGDGLGHDLYLYVNMRDYCGPSMGGEVVGAHYSFEGFPSCEPGPYPIIARFDGVESYVVDCDVVDWDSVGASGHVSGVLRMLDGPHPTPPY